MKQRGKITKAEDGFVYIKINRPSACGENCASCGGLCNNGTHTVKLENTVGAKCGDTVEITAESKNVLIAALFLYMLPVLIMFLAYFAVFAVTKNDFASAAALVLSLLASGFIVRKFDSKIAPKAYISQIVKEEEKPWH